MNTYRKTALTVGILFIACTIASIPGPLLAVSVNYAGYEINIIPSDRQDYAYSMLTDKNATQDSTQSDHILSVLGMSAGSLIPLSFDIGLRLRTLLQAREYGAASKNLSVIARWVVTQRSNLMDAISTAKIM